MAENVSNTVKITLNSEEREFVETLLTQQQFQGNMEQMQQWTRLMDEALLAIHVEVKGHGRTFVVSLDCAQFIGLTVQNTQYQGNLDTMKKVQALGVAIIKNLNAILEPIAKKAEKAAEVAKKKAEREAAKAT